MYTAYNKEGNNIKNRFNKKKERRRRRDNHWGKDFNIRIIGISKLGDIETVEMKEARKEE